MSDAPSNVKGPLKGVTVTFADLGQCTKTTPRKVAGWARAAGAKVAERVGPRVTHLVCSRKYYEDDGEAVVLAKKFPKIKIVSWEWLERSLFNKYCMRFEPYLLSKQVAAAKKEKLDRALQRRLEITKLTKECIDDRAKAMVENNEFLRTPGYDIAFDCNGKSCDVVLFRIDKPNNTSARIILRMCETTSLPRYYGAYAIYRDTEGKEWPEILRYAPSQFHQVFPIFQTFFKEKTGYSWLQRPNEVLLPVEGFWGFI